MVGWTERPDDLIKINEFVLKSYIVFNGKVKKQVETKFLKNQKLEEPVVWFCYTDNVFLVKNISSFSEDLNKFHLNIKFTHETNKECIHVLDLQVGILDGQGLIDLYVKFLLSGSYMYITTNA